LHNLFNNDQYDTCIIPRGDGLSLSIKKWGKNVRNY
jgi:hypothetical protein